MYPNWQEKRLGFKKGLDLKNPNYISTKIKLNSSEKWEKSNYTLT
jgi:hypothetical protein